MNINLALCDYIPCKENGRGAKRSISAKEKSDSDPQSKLHELYSTFTKIAFNFVPCPHSSQQRKHHGVKINLILSSS